MQYIYWKVCKLNRMNLMSLNIQLHQLSDIKERLQFHQRSFVGSVKYGANAVSVHHPGFTSMRYALKRLVARLTG